METIAHTLPTLDKEVMERGPRLSQQQRIPGGDGYNAVFFKMCGEIIKVDVPINCVYHINS